MNDPIATLLRASVHQFIGRLGKDPETRFFNDGGSVTNVNIGINHLGDRNQSDWIKLEVWSEQGQAFADQARKGQLVHVVGRVKTDRWTDRDGEERMQLCCRVEQWKLMEPPAAAPAPAPAAPVAAAPAWHADPPF